MPIPDLIIEKITQGLYFGLSDEFKEAGGKNKFRDTFGFVFQEYVGTLLTNCLSRETILSEWIYAKQHTRTSDWIILKDCRAIFIEAKQSGLYLEGKKWGELQKIRNELIKTIAEGVKQLWRFEQDILSQKYEKLRALSDVEAIERLIVTYDRTYYSNSILREQIQEILKSHIPENYHWHTISIDEFEFVLAMSGENLFDFLVKKRTSATGDTMDFWDYLARNYKEMFTYNQYLTNISDEFFHKTI